LKVLALADFESPALYERFNHTPYKGVEAVISCGDVLPELLEYLVDVLNVPVFYVLGNHDERYLKEPPKGCENIDGKIITFGGMRILGLGGSQRYSDGVLQYTEKEMSWRIRKLYFKLRKGVDIIVTHAPPYGIHEGNDYAHRGFKVFLDLINKYQPLYFLHGHTHMNYNFRSSRISQIGRTKIINCSGFVVLDL